MSSSTKFPSGLNNWAGSDKPTRLDFVGDNEILDQNAMWKDAYDENGDVANAGGITAFALAKDAYDPNGTVALAGGISGVTTGAGVGSATCISCVQPELSVISNVLIMQKHTRFVFAFCLPPLFIISLLIIVSPLLILTSFTSLRYHNSDKK